MAKKPSAPRAKARPRRLPAKKAAKKAAKKTTRARTSREDDKVVRETLAGLALDDPPQRW